MADATYKILIEGFPILTVGTTDSNRAFHPFGFGIVTHETKDEFKFVFDCLKKASLQCGFSEYKPSILIADNAEAIHNGFVACKHIYIILIDRSVILLLIG